MTFFQARNFTSTGARLLGKNIPRASGFGAVALLGLLFAALPAGRAQSLPTCSVNNPAVISGSTGAQGVLDPTNIDPLQGVVWPAGTVTANIAMDTGAVSFFDANGGSLGSAALPGAAQLQPAFPSGILNFVNVHLTPGTTVLFTTSVLGLTPPIRVLSCQEIRLDGGSTLTANSPTPVGPVPGGFLGASGSRSLLGSGGFGPRTGSLPSAGSLYPLIGGAGGGAAAGNVEIISPSGGEGGAAFLLSAAQRITLDGTVNANGLNAGTGLGTSQGGAGGAVRLAALLVEGRGSVTTSGGADSDGVVRSPSGPVEVQAFLTDFFSGTTNTNPIRGNAPVQPIPANLPLIVMEPACDCSTINTGSLTTPDYVLSTPSTSQLTYHAAVFTQNIPDGTFLVFRAVGTDGSVSTASAAISSSTAAVDLALNAGATYQIVATANTPFPSLVLNPAQGFEMSRISPEQRGAELKNDAVEAAAKIAKPSSADVAAQWMKAFGVPVEMASNTTRQ